MVRVSALLVVVLISSLLPGSASADTATPLNVASTLAASDVPITAQISAGGDDDTCALSPLGAVKCWGANNYGQLGLGDTNHRGDEAGEMGDNLPVVDLGLADGVTVTAISSGDIYTCALLSSGAVKCWGRNQYGQLGLGDTNNRGDEAGEMGDNLPVVDLGLADGVSVTAISSGDGYTCALLSSGGVKCWGRNQYGQLGLGDTNNRGDEAGEMGDNLPVVDLGLADGVTVRAISSGGYHACALLSSGGVKCWGRNRYGQLGLGDANNRGDQPDEMGDDLPVVDVGLGATATVIAAGGSHTCALLSSGGVKCWGYNGDGQLGLGDTNYRGDEAGEMGDNLPTVDLGSSVSVTAIAVDGYHTCVLLSLGGVKCWGDNGDGQLGLGDTNYRGDEAGEMGDNLPTVDLGMGVTATAVTTGSSHTCALLSLGGVKCWGRNQYGQLGLGDTNYRGDEAGEMGDALPVAYQIPRIAQTITFSALIDRVFSATPFTAPATANSSLLVTLTSSTTSVCTVSGFQVTMLTAGLCTVTASQAGNLTYLSAMDVARSFTITEVTRPTTTSVASSTTAPLSATNALPAAAKLPETGSNSMLPLGTGVMLLVGGVLLMSLRRQESLWCQPRKCVAD
jgi:LPXTG-motif cell wall-anchored protein